MTEIRREDGSYFYYALYKAGGVYEGQSICATGYGISDSPLGPFKRSKAPIMRDIKVGFSVEDCYIWHNAGKYYALAKDMTKGNWTGVTDGYSYALFERISSFKRLGVPLEKSTSHCFSKHKSRNVLCINFF